MKLLIAFLLSIRLTWAQITYDYIIAGGGTAGLALAVALSSNPKINVAVLEAGPDARTNPDITVPEREGSIAGTKYDWNFTTVAQSSLSGRKIQVPRGKVIGGSSAMHFLIWNRGSKAEFDLYSPVLGIPGWSWSVVDDYSRRSENFTAASAALANMLTSNSSIHGTKGAIRATMPRSVYQFYSDYMLPALRSLKIATPVDRDNGNQTGAGVPPLSIDASSYTRSYSGSAWTAVQGRSNLKVFTNTAATRILWTSTGSTSTASGFAFTNTTSGTAVTGSITAKQVILSAGTIQSPQLLQVSGVGDSSALRAAGIIPVIDLPSVGTQFEDHPSFAGSFSANRSFTGGDYAQTFQDYAQPSRFLNAADYQTASQLLSGSRPSGVSNATWSMVKALFKADEPFIEYGFYFSFVQAYLLHPLSSGTIKVTNNSTTTPPLIDPKYDGVVLSGISFDTWLLSKAVQYYAQNLPQTAALRSINSNFSIAPDTSFQSIQDQVKQNLGTGQHFTGGAPMLPKASGGVVDENLKVYGTSNVYVVDLSIIPTSPGQHTMGLAYMLAEKVAAKFLGTA